MSDKLKKDAASKGEAGSRPLQKEEVDAASLPREDKDAESSEARGKDAASTQDAASAQDSAAPEKPSEPSKEEPKEPDWKTLYALTLADFDNYKKRAARDREDVYRYAESDILKDVLPAVDNLALALANATRRGQETAAPVDGDDSTGAAASSPLRDDPFVKGVRLVYDSLLKSLKDHGAEPFDSVGLPLDTEKMEAIATLPSDEVEEGKVSIESKKGWMLKDKVLRAAQVVVSSGKPQ